ncbi:hypothetical protein AB0N05_17905 [Nocardia sp. NPDC051030]|uniref:hypothetical protein n=1 Tax=Nocardia sp. NPDC051030 TaxID=3155162 RepID=UPI00341503B3
MPENTPGGTHINGGNIVAGNIGGSGNSSVFKGPVSQTVGAESDALATALTDLRSELAALRAVLPATPGPDAHPDEVGELIEDLEGPQPNVGRAVSKWGRLVHRIPESLRTLDGITRIVTLFGQVQDLAS